MTKGYRDSSEYKRWLSIAQQDPSWRLSQETSRLREDAAHRCNKTAKENNSCCLGLVGAGLVGAGLILLAFVSLGYYIAKPKRESYLPFHKDSLILLERNYGGVRYLIRGSDGRLLDYLSNDGDLVPDEMSISLSDFKRITSKEDLKPWTEVSSRFRSLKLEDIPLNDSPIEVKERFLEELK